MSASGEDSDHPRANRRTAAAAGGSDTIKVICRFRPQRRKAHVDGASGECFKLHSDTGSIEFAPDAYESKYFNFDKVFLCLDIAHRFRSNTRIDLAAIAH